MKALFIALILSMLVITADADVTSATPGGFTLEHELVINASRGQVWHAAIYELGQWWHNDHSISGDALARLKAHVEHLDKDNIHLE